MMSNLAFDYLEQQHISLSDVLSRWKQVLRFDAPGASFQQLAVPRWMKLARRGGAGQSWVWGVSGFLERNAEDYEEGWVCRKVSWMLEEVISAMERVPELHE